MKVRNWKQFQSHKDRKPKWIKLYREEILERLDINRLPDLSFRVFVLLLLLASEDPEMNGNLPPIDEIEFRIRIPKAQIVESMEHLEPWIDTSDTVLEHSVTKCSEIEKKCALETETETETETEEKREEKKPKRKRFVPPTPAEVSEFAREIGKPIDAERFCNFYESKGWYVGKNKMQRWKAAVRNWTKNSKPIANHSTCDAVGWTWGYSESDLEKFGDSEEWGLYLDAYSDSLGWEAERGKWPSFEDWKKEKKA